MSGELQRVIRFCIGGAINTTATYVLYLLILTTLTPTAAYTLAFAVGILISYLINTHLVFRAKSSSAIKLKFIVVYGAQYLFGVILLTLMIQVLDIKPEIAGLIAALVSAVLAYSLLRTKVFARALLPNPQR